MSNSNRRVHIKYGSKTVINAEGLDQQSKIDDYAQRIAFLEDEQGYKASITSSGAVAKGKRLRREMGRSLEGVAMQTLAAEGSAGIVEDWRIGFKPYGKMVGQMPVVHNQIRRRLWMNRQAKALIKAHEGLEQDDNIPVYNNVDVVTPRGSRGDELQKIAKGGDNDFLAVRIAKLLRVDVLLLCTSGVEGFEENGVLSPFIYASEAADLAADHTYAPNEEGTGSMGSKLIAGAMGATAGIDVYICNADADYAGVIAGDEKSTRVIQ